MEGNTTTAQAAVQDFEKTVWPTLFVGKRDSENKEYARVYGIIRYNRTAPISPLRAAWLLETYGGDRYQVATTFKIVSDAT